MRNAVGDCRKSDWTMIEEAKFLDEETFIK